MPERVAVKIISQRFCNLHQLFVSDSVYQVCGDLLATAQVNTIVRPLPDLRASDLGSSRVLHQIENRYSACSTQPGRQVLQADTDIVAKTSLSDLTTGTCDIEDVAGRDRDFVSLTVQLICFGRRARH